MSPIPLIYPGRNPWSSKVRSKGIISIAAMPSNITVSTKRKEILVFPLITGKRSGTTITAKIPVTIAQAASELTSLFNPLAIIVIVVVAG